MAKRFKPIRSDGWRRVPVIFKDKPFDVPVNRSRSSYTADDLRKWLGQWLEFDTPWGHHRGLIEEVKNGAVLMKMPANSAPYGWMNHAKTNHRDFQLVGFPGGDGFDGHPFRCFKRGPWFWWWIPVVVIIFIFPCFCW